MAAQTVGRFNHITVKNPMYQRQNVVRSLLFTSSSLTSFYHQLIGLFHFFHDHVGARIVNAR